MVPVLIIDDDQAFRSRLKAHLVSKEYRVSEASDGKAGLKRFSETQPSLVLVDLIMPIMDGLETIGALRRLSAPPRIIAMADDGSEGRMPAGLLLKIARNMGAQHALAKPFSLGELDLAMDVVLKAEAASPTFLVLDDDMAARYLSRRTLMKAFPGSTIVECASIPEALIASEAEVPDAIITDHHLGHEDGIDFLERLRGLGVRCPVLMVTGNSDPAVHRRAYDAGADRVFFGTNPDYTAYLRQRLSLD